MSKQNEDFFGAQQILESLIPVANYNELLQSPDFWKHFSVIKNTALQSRIRESIVQYFRCKQCKQRLRRFPNSSYICFNCGIHSEGIPDLSNQPNKLNCLGCFKSYKPETFSNSECKHLCGYCVAKEQLKNRESCKICLNPFKYVNSSANCSTCHEAKHFGGLNELRCGCIFCNDCFREVRKQKRCLNCAGINVLTSELYEFNKKDYEFCFECGENKPIKAIINEGTVYEFLNKECCYLDICMACYKSQGKTVCIGCDQTLT